MNMEFIGPANEIFDSFMDQSKSFLAYHCPGWNDYEYPTSYLMPPKFCFRHPEKSDTEFEESLEKLRKKKENTKLAGGGQPSSKSDPDDRFVIDRLSCTAEHVVYESINRLIQDNISAPFIALHDLDINKKEHFLPQILLEPEQFSQIVKKLRQYDFILIGPKIGFVVIEVKSSKFDNSHSFKNKHMPDQYSEGIDQLNSIDALLSGLGNGFRLDPSKDIPIRKILFTQNLERERYLKWMEHLQPDDRLRVSGKIGQIIQWFKEDMTNSGQHGLCMKLRSFLEEPNVISKELYETYAPILTGISSAIIQKGQTRKVELDVNTFSLAQAVRSESSRVATQDPKEILKENDGVQAITIGEKKIVKHFSRVILLTPKQNDILKSPRQRLFIVGPAGVGKTIILQEKALEWMKAGQSVIILARKPYMDKYMELFNEHKCDTDKFKVEWWDSYSGALYFWKPNEQRFQTLSSTCDLYDLVYDIIMHENEYYQHYLSDLFKFDHILIDDGLDKIDGERNWRCLPIPTLAIMAFSQRHKLKSTVWIALDLYGYLATVKELHAFRDIHQNGVDIVTELAQIFTRLFSENYQPSDVPQEKYCTAALQDVMRCPKNVFSIAHKMDLIERDHIPDDWRPKLGHKIQGVPFKTISINLSGQEDGVEQVKIQLNKLLGNFFRQNIPVPPTNIAVITDFHPDEVQKYLQKVDNDTNFEHWRKEVNMYSYSDISSMEWPIVIHILQCTEGVTNVSMISVNYVYRAFSRATGQVIQIIVTNPNQESSQEEIAQFNCVRLFNLTMGDVVPKGEGYSCQNIPPTFYETFEIRRLRKIFKVLKKGKTRRKCLKILPGFEASLFQFVYRLKPKCELPIARYERLANSVKPAHHQLPMMFHLMSLTGGWTDEIGI